MQVFVGYPFETGHFPFLMHFKLSEKHFVFSGSTSPIDSERGLLVLDETDFLALSERLKDEMVKVPLENGLWLLDRAFHQLNSEEYLHLRSCTSVEASPVSLPSVDYDNAYVAMPLMDPSRGCFFGLAEGNLQDGLKAVQLAKKNPIEQQRKILDAAIETVADLAVNPNNRSIWATALMMLSLIAKVKKDDEVEALALQNAAAFERNHEGSKIPFVKSWVSRQLLSGVALARMVGKAESKI